MKKIVGFLMILILCSTVSAFLVSGPKEVILNKEEIEIPLKIQSNALEGQKLKVEYFGPGEYTLKAPVDINANVVPIILKIKNNKEFSNKSYLTTLIVTIEKEKVDKKILITYNTKKIVDNNTQSNPFTGLISLIPLQSLSEIAVNFALVIIAIALFTALIIRIVKPRRKII